VKFNEYNAVVVSAGYDRTVRAFDCRSQNNDPIQVVLHCYLYYITASRFVIFPYLEVLYNCFLLSCCRQLILFKIV
jgi:hypothetical protein